MEWTQEKLNEQQRKAVTSTEGYLRVIAGAGTGKTRLLIYRYAYLISEVGIDPANILCVTFTNKAAGEMKKRAKQLLGMDCLENGMISTFDSLCVRILREDGIYIGWPENFMVIDREDRKSIVQEIIEERKIRERGDFIRIDYVMDYINNMKDTGVDLIETLVHNHFISYHKDIYDEIFHHFLKKQRTYFALDFEDLLKLVLYLFEHNEEVLSKWQNKMAYIMVDEYQDVDGGQKQLLHLLQGKYHNVMIVGDPDQSIYSFRGAKVERITYFDDDYTPTIDIPVTLNYRSSKPILENANSLVKNNTIRLDKDLICVGNNSDILPVHYYSKSETEESRYIVNKIKELVKENKLKYKDVMILYRASFLSRSIEQQLIREKVPYLVYSGIRFYEREEIKDIISYMKLLEIPDDMSVLRIINKPLRKIGPVKEKLIKDLAEELSKSYYEIVISNLELFSYEITEFVTVVEKYRKKKDTYEKISELVDEYINEIGYIKYRKERGEDERLENIAEMMQSIRQYEEDNKYEGVSLSKYLQDIALYTSQDEIKERDVVSLMTIHAAKGLEYECVFSIGWNEGILPNKKSLEQDKKRGLEEERRLAYVALTRAKKYLFITNNNGSRNIYRSPSRFLLELNDTYLERVNCDKDSLIKEIDGCIKNEYDKIVINKKIDNEWNIGDKVKHQIFGVGEVIDVRKMNILVKFNSLDSHPKPFLKTFIGLEKIDIN